MKKKYFVRLDTHEMVSLKEMEFHSNSLEKIMKRVKKDFESDFHYFFKADLFELNNGNYKKIETLWNC